MLGVQNLIEKEEFKELMPKLAIGLGIIVLYLIYRWIFKGMTFKVSGNYDQKLRNIGRPLPSFPNGWFVAARSYQVVKGQSLAVDIAGQNLVVFRSVDTGQPYILEAYCKHLGANLGIGGKVVNKKCISCPFHGWIYDGETGLCVDHNGKAVKGLNVQYNDDFCEEGKKLEWIHREDKEIRLRKYPACELNGYIYVWIHALPEHQQKPLYKVFDMSNITKKLEFRARTIHQINCHAQDIPENGADVYHFKYVHSQIIPKINIIQFLWLAKWRRGDDPDVREIFQHDVKYARDFKQMVYKQLIENYPNKNMLSIGYIDNYLVLPIFGRKFMFNVTIIQQGSSLVYILLVSPIYQIVFFHFLQPKQKFKQIVTHECYASKWLPYWATAFATKMQGNQVTNDMYIWDAKRFARNIHFRKGDKADQYLKSWREWYSQHYQGCKQKEKNLCNDW